MRLQELGYVIRKARQARGLSQAQLAAASGVSRTTINQLENGVFPDLGLRKAQDILEHLGLDLRVQPAPRRPNYVRMACTSASVSFRETLSEPELTRALLTGRVPAKRRPHLRALLDEAPIAVLQGLTAEIARWTRPGRIPENLVGIAKVLGCRRRPRAWLPGA
jgi:transcriptional regulator with XRE-family HTH domain